ncbi:MAG TPA: hypothetical protein P5525_08870 [Candidatus Paceibacterota bacterium]|nr:hypothetical protein [Candidatus Paceibacterota bacterium]
MNRLQQIQQEVLAAGREWMRTPLEKRLQAECLAVDMVSAKTGEALENTRWRTMGLDTVVGKVDLKVHHGFCPQEGWVCPTRQAWALKPYERKTPELRARLTYTATVVGSYAEAQKLATIWGTPVSDTSIHQCVQELGPQAQKLALPPPVPAPSEPAFDLVIMMDGWLTRERGPDWSAGPRKQNPERVEWKEIKSAVIYRLEQRAENASGRGLLLEKHVVATPPDTSPLDFGQAVREEAMRRGLARAKTVYLVMDRAVWLWDLADDRFQAAVKTLDFHHAREHLNTIAEALYGTGTQRAKDWLAAQVKSLRHGDEALVVNRLEDLIKSQAQARRPTKSRKTIAREVKYFRGHRDHIHYQDRENEGAPLGSGAVESLGKQLQRRMRGCGQFWRRSGLSNLLKLSVLAKNDDLHLLWN